MIWAPEQESAMSAVLDWHGAGTHPLFRLFGYAGVGKTTLAQEIAARAGGSVLYAAFTGKAASVLRAKGCTGAQTIHKLIYTPSERDTAEIDRLKQLIEEREKELGDETLFPNDATLAGLERDLAEAKSIAKRPRFTLNEESAITGADLLIIDEVSMVDEKMGNDLLSFGTPVLVLGDPAQLPPVRGTGYFIDGTPDILLTQIHRQCEDSPIIDLATAVGTGSGLRVGQYGESSVVPWGDASILESAKHADQILVGKNITRRQINGRMRQLFGLNNSPTPVRGDKVICLRNDYEVGILNGTLWGVVEAAPAEYGRVPMIIRPWDDFDNDTREIQVSAHEAYFLGNEPEFYEMRDAQHFDYGYAITVHKAQGSQWDSVVLFDESNCFREDARKHLYTGITRAAKTIKVVVR